MSDVTFTAKVSISREVDTLGLPVTTATVAVDEYAAALPLPAGKEGKPGLRGRPKTTWLKRGTVTNASALTILDPADRDLGHWWHNLATNGMETWTEIGWVSSPGAVGPAGRIAGPYNLSASGTTSDPKLVAAGAQINDAPGGQTLKVTIPAGPQGIKGPIGTAGPIADSADYDDTIGPSNGSVFGWNRGTKKFRPLPISNGFGPWQTAQSDFRADETGIGDEKRTMATLNIPALPFAWRPMVTGVCRAAAGGSRSQSTVMAYVRINSANGPICAVGINPWWEGITTAALGGEVLIRPAYGEKVTSTAPETVIAAGEPTTLFLSMERKKAENPWTWRQSPGYLMCYALPVM